MGNQFLKNTQKQFNSKIYNWEVTSTTPYCTKVKDRRTHLKAQKYKVEYRQFQKDFQSYLVRHKHQKYLVSIYDVISDKTDNLCSVNHQISVVVEQIPYRLSDLGAISLQEGLYVMTCILRACEVLRQNKIGFYLLDQTNICFNNNGQCKYWINQNLFGAKPIPNRTISQSEFIKTLWEIVSQRVNEVNSFFEEPLDQFDQLTLESMRSKVDRVLERSLVGLPALVSMNKDENEYLIMNQPGLKTKNSNDSSDQKKISLANYHYPKSSARQIPPLHQEKTRNRGRSTAKKVSLNRAGRMEPPARRVQKLTMKMPKRNTTPLHDESQYEPIEPFHSHIFTSPLKESHNTIVFFNSPNQKFHSLVSAPHLNTDFRTPKMRFSYYSPTQPKYSYK